MEGTNQEIPSGDTQQIPSGNIEEIEGGKTGNDTKEVVDRETYLKTLSQEKNAKARLKEAEARIAEYEAQQKKVEEAKLKENGEYQKLLSQRDKEIEEERKQRQELEKSMLDSLKLGKVIDHIGGRVKRSEYLNFIDTDRIVYNPETREIDDETAKSVAEDFVKTHAELIDFKVGKLPSDSPRGAESLTVEQWRKLPLKDKKAKMHLVKGFKKFG